MIILKRLAIAFLVVPIMASVFLVEAWYEVLIQGDYDNIPFGDL